MDLLTQTHISLSYKSSIKYDASSDRIISLQKTYTSNQLNNELSNQMECERIQNGCMETPAHLSSL